MMQAAKSPAEEGVCEVAVLLGDPRLPDAAKVDHRYSREDLEAVERLKAALAELAGYRFTYLDNHETLLADLQASRAAFVLNFCDTGYRNVQAQELHIPAYLEILGLPYSGAPPRAMVTCYDKALVRAVAASLGIPVPEESLWRAWEPAPLLPAAYPCLVKPNRGDGSLGINQNAVVRNTEETRAQVDWARRTAGGGDILLQEFLPGREFSVGLIGNPGLGLQALPLLEVDYSGLPVDLAPILAYESKTVPDSPFWTEIKFHEADLRDEERQRLIGYATLLFERLSVRDYGRFDFRAAADGTLKLMEVNPNPAWCWDGKMNIMAGFGSHSYADFLRLLLEAARARLGR